MLHLLDRHLCAGHCSHHRLPVGHVCHPSVSGSQSRWVHVERLHPRHAFIHHCLLKVYIWQALCCVFAVVKWQFLLLRDFWPSVVLVLKGGSGVLVSWCSHAFSAMLLTWRYTLCEPPSQNNDFSYSFILVQWDYTRKLLYHLRFLPLLFCFAYFWDRVSLICLGWPLIQTHPA